MVSKLVYAAFEAKRTDNAVNRAVRSERYYQGQHDIKKNREMAKVRGDKVYNVYGELFSKRLSRFIIRKPKFDFKPTVKNGQEGVTPEVAQALDLMITDKAWSDMEMKSDGDFAEDEIIECMHAGSVVTRAIIDDETFMPELIHTKCEHLLYDPPAENLQQATYIGFMSRMPVDEIKQVFKKNVNADNGLLDMTDHFGETPISAKVNNNRIADVWRANQESSFRRSFSLADEARPHATVIEIWKDDPEREPIPFEDQEIESEHMKLKAGVNVPVSKEQHHPKHIEAHEREMALLDPEADAEYLIALEGHIRQHEKLPDKIKKATTQLKYPEGRQIIFCNGVILKDEKFPFETYWKNLVIKTDWEKNRSNFWGKGFGHDLFDRQDAINHRKNSITLNSNLVNVGIVKVKASVYKHIKKWTNLIGKYVPVRHENDVTTDYGTPMPAQFFKEYYDDIQGMKDQSGETASLTGELPAPGTAHSTVKTLLEQGNQSTGLPMRHYIQSLQKKARALVHLLITFQPDIEVIVNDRVWTPADLAQVKGIRDVEVGVRVNTSTREQQVQESLLLYSQKLYDRQAALEHMEDPRIDSIMQRLDENAILKAQMEGLLDEYKKLQSQLNTVANRAQANTGEGNVGALEGVNGK